MTGQHSTHPPTEDTVEEQEVIKLPRWVPLTVGALLVLIAVLAVYTGLTSRSQGLGQALRRIPGVNRIQDRGGPPGEPEAGASRVLHGQAGDTIPIPDSAVEDETRIAITGGRDGVVPSIRLSARRGIILRVDPPEAIVYVNDKPMGTAAQFSTPDQAWEFPDVAEGTFTIRLVAPGYREYEYVVSTDPGAETEVATLEVKLARH